MVKIALLVGINYVQSGRRMQLRGCHNDVKHLYEYLLSSRGYERENVRKAMDRDPAGHEATSKCGIIEGIMRMANRTWREDVEEVFISYSGHGTQVVDDDGDEEDGQDEALIPSDYHVSGVIRDDKINELLREFNPKTRVICWIDCCHSGTIADLPHQFDIRDGHPGPVYTHLRSGVETPAPVTCITGCRDSQVSMDAYNVTNQGKFTGAMTSCLLEVLRELGAAPPASDAPPPLLSKVFQALHAKLRQKGFAQRPVLAASTRLTLEGAF